MNTVLDDNKMLCMPSGETIKLNEGMTMMFEVEDLKVASPATVSRCGMVFLEPHRLGWHVLIDSYVDSLPYFLKSAQGELIKQFLTWIVYPVAEYVRKKCKLPAPVGELEMVSSTLNIIDCFLDEYRQMTDQEEDSPTKNEPKEYVLPKDIDEQLLNIMLFSVIWGFGSVTDETTRPKFVEFFKKLLDGDNVKLIFKLLDTPDDWEPKRYDFKLPGEYFDIVYTKKKDVYA